MVSLVYGNLFSGDIGKKFFFYSSRSQLITFSHFEFKTALGIFNLKSIVSSLIRISLFGFWLYDYIGKTQTLGSWSKLVF